MSSVPWKARAVGGRLRGRAPGMSSTLSDAGTRTARARRSSAMVALGLRVTDMEAKRSAPSLGTAASGCRMKVEVPRVSMAAKEALIL